MPSAAQPLTPASLQLPPADLPLPVQPRLRGCSPSCQEPLIQPAQPCPSPAKGRSTLLLLLGPCMPGGPSAHFAGARFFSGRARSSTWPSLLTLETRKRHCQHELMGTSCICALEGPNDSSSRYPCQSPSACTIVRGTELALNTGTHMQIMYSCAFSQY